MPQPRAVVLWTGGKDSCLALHEARESGTQISGLATFVPPHARFLAHPLPVLRRQAAALSIPHEEFEVEPPFEKGYENAIGRLCRRFRCKAVITGDIAEVGGRPNWITARAKKLGVEVLKPLWGRNRRDLLERLLEHGYRAVISAAKVSCLQAHWIGREIDSHCISDLKKLSRKTGLDMCGEQGEYHTLVIDGPSFAGSVELGSPGTVETDGLRHLDLSNFL